MLLRKICEKYQEKIAMLLANLAMLLAMLTKISNAYR
jgi:hypothetical protein